MPRSTQCNKLAIALFCLRSGESISISQSGYISKRLATRPEDLRGILSQRNAETSGTIEAPPKVQRNSENA